MGHSQSIQEPLWRVSWRIKLLRTILLSQIKERDIHIVSSWSQRGWVCECWMAQPKSKMTLFVLQPIWAEDGKELEIWVLCDERQWGTVFMKMGRCALKPHWSSSKYSRSVLHHFYTAPEMSREIEIHWFSNWCKTCVFLEHPFKWLSQLQNL